MCHHTVLRTPCLVPKSLSFEVERLKAAPGAPVEPSCQRLVPPGPRAPSPDGDQTSQTGPPETTQHPRVPGLARSAPARKQAPKTCLRTHQEESGGARVGRRSTPTSHPGQKDYDDCLQSSSKYGCGPGEAVPTVVPKCVAKAALVSRVPRIDPEPAVAIDLSNCLACCGHLLLVDGRLCSRCCGLVADRQITRLVAYSEASASGLSSLAGRRCWQHWAQLSPGAWRNAR